MLQVQTQGLIGCLMKVFLSLLNIALTVLKHNLIDQITMKFSNFWIIKIVKQNIYTANGYKIRGSLYF